jgi:hypothetical protein
MRKLRPIQRKSLSEFFNTLAVTWFSAGIITPIFAKPDDFPRGVGVLFLGLFFALLYLMFSLYLIKDLKL